MSVGEALTETKPAVETWYSRADREALAQGKPLPDPPAPLTKEDYEDLLNLALREAVENSPAKDLFGSASVADLSKDYGNDGQNHDAAGRSAKVPAGVTRTSRAPKDATAGKYDVVIDWGRSIQDKVMDPKDGRAYLAQRFSTVFHEVHHVEQRAMVDGVYTMDEYIDRRLEDYAAGKGIGRDQISKADERRETEKAAMLYKEVVTQSLLNRLYPGMYARTYRTDVVEVDADTDGLRGAIAFFDRHPEIKSRYRFDYDKQIMRTDEYNLMEDRYQVTKGTPEEMLALMDGFRADVYGTPAASKGSSGLSQSPGTSEATFRSKWLPGMTAEDLAGLTADERNTRLVEAALEAINGPDAGRISSSLRAYADHPALKERWDQDLNREFEASRLGMPVLYSTADRADPEESAVMSYELEGVSDRNLAVGLEGDASSYGSGSWQDFGPGCKLDSHGPAARRSGVARDGLPLAERQEDGKDGPSVPSF